MIPACPYGPVSTRLLLAAAFLCAATARGEDLRQRFEWVRPIRGELEARRLYRASLPPDTFGRMRRFPEDLRVIDAKGRLCPFTLDRPSGGVRVETRATQMLNRSRVEGAIPFEQADLELAPADAARRHNSLVVRTPGSGFLRRVELFGSDAGGTWALLARGYLVRDATGTPPVQNDRIDYPDATFRRLRVRVYPDAHNVNEPLSIDALKVQYRTTASRPMEPVPLTVVPDPEPVDPDSRSLLLDTGWPGVPVDELRVTAGDAEFSRTVRVYGRDTAEEPWRLLACTSLYRISGREHLAVELGTARVRWLRTVVRHFDDPPLRGVRVAGWAVPTVLACEGTDAEAALFYGADSVAAARFDLAARAGAARVKAATPLELEEPIRNPMYRPHRVELSRAASLAGVAVVSVLVLGVIVAMLRRHPRSPA